METTLTEIRFNVNGSERTIPQGGGFENGIEPETVASAKKDLLKLFSNPASASFQDSLENTQVFLTAAMGIESLDGVSFDIVEYDNSGENIVMQSANVTFADLAEYGELATRMDWIVKPERKKRVATDSTKAKIEDLTSVFSAQA